MNVQYIIVGLLLFGALFYIGKQVLSKAKSFSGSKSCGSDCGCDSGTKPKNVLTRIKRG